MSLKRKTHIIFAVMVLGFLTITAGSGSGGSGVIQAGLLICLAGFLLLIAWMRCPHCGKSILRGRGNRCPHCKREIDSGKKK